MQLINTSTLAKHYRTTTGDIEKRLKDAGLTPIKTVTMQSGRRFMVWDQDAAMKAMDDYKAARMELLKAREAQRQELKQRFMVEEFKTQGGPVTFKANYPEDMTLGAVLAEWQHELAKIRQHNQQVHDLLVTIGDKLMAVEFKKPQAEEGNKGGGGVNPDTVVF